MAGSEILKYLHQRLPSIWVWFVRISGKNLLLKVCIWLECWLEVSVLEQWLTGQEEGLRQVKKINVTGCGTSSATPNYIALYQQGMTGEAPHPVLPLKNCQDQRQLFQTLPIHCTNSKVRVLASIYEFGHFRKITFKHCIT